jgi:hypothetical protein
MHPREWRLVITAYCGVQAESLLRTVKSAMENHDRVRSALMTKGIGMQLAECPDVKLGEGLVRFH